MVTVVSVVILFVGSQVARWRGQNVDWYAGFGVWLGALGSVIAAGVALWIAVTERSRIDAERAHAEAREDADLARQAGLVRVTAAMLSKRQAVGSSYGRAGIEIRNRRAECVFEINIVRYVLEGQVLDVEIDGFGAIDLFPRDREGWYHAKELPNLALEPHKRLSVFPHGLPDTPADYAAVEYTDISGRRWRVDTEGEVTRL